MTPQTTPAQTVRGHWAWRWGRRVLWGLAALVLTLALLVGGALGFARSAWGQAHILAWVLPVVQRSLTGTLRVGRLRGDLWHQLTLSAIDLQDADGQPALHVDEVALRYDLSALRARLVHVQGVKLSGVRVAGRYLRDGRLNLAALTIEDPGPKPASTRLPVAVRVDSIAAQVALTLNGGAGALAQAAADVTLRAGLSISPELAIAVRVEGLHVAAAQPLRAEVDLQGTLNIAGTVGDAAAQARPVTAGISLSDVRIGLRSDGAEINRVVPAAGLRAGPLSLQALLQGDLQGLVSQIDLALPKGQVRLQAKVGVLDPALPWTASLQIQDVELATLRADLPPLRVDVDVRGQGAAAAGSLEVRKLDVQAANNALHAQGTLALPTGAAGLLGTFDPLAATADLKLSIAAPRLADLHATHALLPPLAGALTGTIQIDLQARSLHVVSQLAGRSLSGFGAAVDQVRADVDVRDLTGHAQIDVQGARYGDQQIAQATLRARGNDRDVDLQASARATVSGQALSAELALRALPTYTPERRLSVLVVDLRSLALQRERAAGVDRVNLLEPARVVLSDLLRAPTIETAAAQAGLDVATALRRGGVLRLGVGDLRLAVAGRFETATRRIVQGRVDVEQIDAQQLAFMAIGRTDVPRTHLALHAQVAGALSAPQGSVRLEGTVDPLPGVVPWQDPVTLALAASGSLDRPRGTVTIRVPAFQQDDIRGDGATLDLSYADRVLQAKVQVPRLTTQLAPVGEVVLGANVDVTWRNDDLSGHAAVSYAGAPWLQAQVNTKIAQQDLISRGAAVLPQLPIQAALDMPAFALPKGLPATGRVALQARVTGSVAQPEASLQMVAEEIAVSTWRVGVVQAQAQLQSRGGRLMRLQAIVDPRPQARAVELVRMAPMDSSGEAPAPDGTLRLRAEVPWPLSMTSAALHGSLSAKNYRLDYESPADSKSALRRARGTLNADLRVEGGSPQPVAAGGLVLSEGEVAATSLPQLLRNIAIDVQVSRDGRIALRDLSASAGTGSLRSTGLVDIRGGRLQGVQLQAKASKFPVAAGPYTAWLDTQIDIQGQSDGQRLRTRVLISRGVVQVPKLSAGTDAQALGPLADVEFVDAAGRRARAAALAAQEAERRDSDSHKAVPLLPERTEIAVEMPGPFVINGPEVKTDLEGHVDIAMNSEGGVRGDPIIHGDLHALNGWLEILGRRYQIDRAQASLSGEVPPNPLLDVSISRKVEDATIYILVTGTAQKPVIQFRSDPATYDQGQIIAMVLSGSSRGGGSIQQQALGALSSLLVGTLKEQLGAAVPVDVIKFDVGGSDALGANQSSVEIGKYLRDNLYLSYTHRFGNPSTILRRMNNDQVALEWWFLRNYQIHLMGGDQGVGSLNLYWYKRF